MDDQLIISSGTALHSVIIARNDSVANALNTKNTNENDTILFWPNY